MKDFRIFCGGSTVFARWIRRALLFGEAHIFAAAVTSLSNFFKKFIFDFLENWDP